MLLGRQRGRTAVNELSQRIRPAREGIARRTCEPGQTTDGSAVSVIIPNYNGAALLSACLEALHAQTLRPYEVIVVDDGSTDSSCELVRARFPWVRLLPLAANGGFCRAANAGLRAARGELLALLNNDAQPAAGWLGALVDALGQHPDVGACASRMLFFDDPGRVNSAGLFMRVDGMARDIGFGQPDGPQFSAPAMVFGASGGAALYRRELLEDVGLFDEELVAYGEDVDLAFRAQWRGWTCLYVPSAVVYHHVGATYGRESASAAFYRSRNTLIVLLKNMPARVLWRYWPVMLAAQVYQVAYLATRGHGEPALRGKWGALRELPSIWARRQKILHARRVPDRQIEAVLCPLGWHGRFPHALVRG